MAFTKAMGRTALAYVIEHVLDFNTNHVTKAFAQNGITNIWDILGMTYDDIETLTYEDDQGATVDITKGDKGKVRCLKCYNLHMEQEGNKIVGDAWNQVTADEFNGYRISALYTSTKLDMSGASLPATTPLQTSAYTRNAITTQKLKILPILSKCGL
jgi:hypothetical protein